ncbi:MAG: hypothetical protein LBH39_08505 [Clostridiales Family XIII bacterium]|jgi:hypothetical protein|nr:hypothetical protein [Clostridiales Family XIII bacterium]
MRDLLLAGEIYFLAFVIGMLMAAIIKIMLFVIRRISPENRGAGAKAGQPDKGGGAA